MISIHKCIPEGYTPRESQTEYFKFVEKNWNNLDVLCNVAPTGAGKSLMNLGTSKWREQFSESTAILAPRKFLQDQYVSEFPWLTTLKGADNYICNDCLISGQSCRAKKRLTTKYCAPDQCPYLIAKAAAAASKTTLFNFHSYFVNEMFKSNMIIDEGHGTVDLLYSLFSKKIWKCEFDYPDDIEITSEGVALFLSGIIKNMKDKLAMFMGNNVAKELLDSITDEIDQIETLQGALSNNGSDFIVRKKKEKYFGETKHLKNSEQEYIYVKALRVDKIAENVLWPKNTVKKIIFSSATLSKIEMDLLGLGSKRIMFHEGESPIPWESRMLVIDPVANMTFAHRKESIPKIAKKIIDIAKQFPDQKGVVHCTYDVAKQLKVLLGEGKRYLFHDSRNKEEVLKYFMACGGNYILVASGMAEGIDLKDDLARFQIIVMLQFPSLVDDVMEWIAKNNPMLYKWFAIRNLIQQTGRIVRGKDDYGITYFIGEELTKGFFNSTEHLWPGWFKKSMVWKKG